MYPRIHLAIDNCFASKRWSTPDAWAKVVADLGIQCVEASADNECDPLYSTPKSLADWIKQVKEARERYGVRVVNLYSGHGTYSTLGLGHNDKRVREHLLHHWLFPMIETAGSLDAGLGFFMHAFSLEILDDPQAYALARSNLVSSLSQAASHASQHGVVSAGVEQMYTPHQIPWTVAGALELLKDIYLQENVPFYLSLDTGHASGQRRFLRPTYGQLKEALNCRSNTAEMGQTPWLGSTELYDRFKKAEELSGTAQDAVISEILERFDHFGYLFAEDHDSDPYVWMERLGCYSPIVHLQQTDGARSAHLPFTSAQNQTGIIHPANVLQAIACAYEQPVDKAMPLRIDDIYLTLEIFSGTADRWPDIIEKLRVSVKYWREFVPEDGVRLDALLQDWDLNK